MSWHCIGEIGNAQDAINLCAGNGYKSNECKVTTEMIASTR